MIGGRGASKEVVTSEPLRRYAGRVREAGASQAAEPSQPVCVRVTRVAFPKCPDSFVPDFDVLFWSESQQENI